MTEALQSLAPSSSATRRLRGVLEQPSTPPGYATDVCERDVTTWVNYYICACSKHLLGFLLKCNKNYIILKKMPSAAQWHHPSTYGTKITGIQNFGHLCLGALYLHSHSQCMKPPGFLSSAPVLPLCPLSTPPTSQSAFPQSPPLSPLCPLLIHLLWMHLYSA